MWLISYNLIIYVYKHPNFNRVELELTMTVVVLLLCFHPQGPVKELLSNLELRKVKICCWSTEIFLLKSCLLWFRAPLFIDMDIV